MKIKPEANNHVKLELDMGTLAPKRWLDVNEGTHSGIRFVIMHMQVPRGDPIEPFEVSFVTEEEGVKTFVVNSVKISTRREKEV